MDYKACLDSLFCLRANGAKGSLDVMRQLSCRLNFPEKSFTTIHVAGTNGKGSVVTKIAASLQKEGYRVGRYMSPHISSFRERICINGEMISEEDIVEGMERLYSLGISAAFFEYTTMLAFDYFARKQVDIAVLETGLGGRFDATNICEPILTVITSISLDHTQILGASVEEIAYEKIGIAKEGVPLVIGPQVPRGLLKIPDGVPYYFVDEVGIDYEEENRLIAKKALELLSKDIPIKKESIEEGLKAVPPCRFELFDEAYLVSRFGSSIPKAVIFDVAHNVDGLQKLFARLRQSFGKTPVCVLCGLSQDKEVQGCLQEIVESSEMAVFVQASSGRAMSAGALLEIAKELNQEKSYYAFEDLKEGMKEGFAHASSSGGVLVVCGTFFIMDDCRRWLEQNSLKL